ncbi:hypothetical protein [Xenorhabdus koppenhoeferi]|uniref:Uncharacterized protein n=1 Tax=Xenorhabdus koppenhoeferi TaxID=351659 RepID=A0A1I7KNR3_9GAMM|nr:hypothetical protein [Xenorhabdus koppenhoeferi]SFU99061.1 hypothetical protein SAMN05421784_1882 [Xenorhabdus koppenhoeferi]
MNNEFENNTIDDISSRLKTAAKATKTYSRNEITINCDELIQLCDAVEELAKYENMKPVGFTNEVELAYIKNGLHGFIQVESDKKSFLSIPLYRHPK